jgi:hypothetical protein
VLRARLSGESRISFHIEDENRKRPKWFERRITVDNLTEWRDLALTVNNRALGPNKTIEDQLCIAGIHEQTSYPDAVKLVAAQLKPPDPSETALEMTGRLIFSPSKDAGWIVPRGKIDSARAPLWHARLDEVGRKSVRAIWSNWLTPGKFPAVQGQPIKLAEADRLLVLCPIDHWEIVAQTSLYGLLALRNSEDESQENDSFPVKAYKTLKSLMPGTTEEAPRKIPRNRVVRPRKPYASLNYLSQAASGKRHKYPPEDVGFGLVEPFEDANVILTSMGGSLAAEWNGEPFDTPRLYEDLPPSFSLERFVYRTQLGRDIHIEVFTKGYLLPLGVRASFVQLSERRFFPHPTYGYPTSYLVKRSFIVIRRGSKRFPAVGQQYQSRDFPVSEINMVTRTTPDLKYPEKRGDPIDTCTLPSGGKVAVYASGFVEVPGSRVTSGGNGPGSSNPTNAQCVPSGSELVFWPRVTEGNPGTPGDAEFKWNIDSDHTPVVGKLLFVSNTSAKNPEVMQQVAEYYRCLGSFGNHPAEDVWHPLRVARLFGTRRRYAPPKPHGETAFDTDSWLLSLRGPADSSGTGESFDGTIGSLVRADQPPFYPTVARAKITAQSLDRLLGAPQGLLLTQFHPMYVQSGFDEPKNQNPSELFLEVLFPKILLNANSNGTSTGGLSRPNASLAALSRTIGFVGGQAISGSQLQQTQVTVAQQLSLLSDAANSVSSASGNSSQNPQRPALTGPPPSPPQFQFRGAETGKFEPSEFFEGTAKLLGLIDLKELLTDLGSPEIGKGPKLLEEIGYGPAAGEGASALNHLAGLLNTVRVQLNGIKEQIDESIAKALPSGKLRSELTFDKLYHGLSTAIDQFSQEIQQFKDDNKVGRLAGIFYSGQNVLAELQRTLLDPVPEAAIDQIATLGSQWNSLKDFPRQWLDQQGAILRSQFTALLAEASGRVFQLGSQLSLFGVDSITTIKDDPGSWVTLAENALFSSSLAQPLASASSQLQTLQNSVAPEQIARALQTTVEGLARAIEFTGIAQRGAFIKNWSQPRSSHAVPKAFSFALGATKGLLAPQDADEKKDQRFLSLQDLFDTPSKLRETLTQIQNDVRAALTQKIGTPAARPDLLDKLSSARTDLMANLEEFSKAVAGLRQSVTGQSAPGTQPEVESIEQLTKEFETHQKEIYRDSAAFLNSVRNVVIWRRRSMQTLVPLTNSLNNLESILRDIPDRTSAHLNDLSSAANRLALACGDITGITQIGTNSKSWQLVSDQLKDLSAELSAFQTYATDIQDVRSSATTLGSSLLPHLQDTRTANELLGWVDAASAYSRSISTGLVSLGLQSIALPWMDAAIILQKCSNALLSATTQYANLHAQAANAVLGVKTAINASILEYLIDPAVLTRLDEVANALTAEAKTLNDIASVGAALADIRNLAEMANALPPGGGNPNQQEVIRHEADRLQNSAVEMADKMLAFIRDANSKGGVSPVRALSVLTDIVENVIHSNLTDLFNRALIRPVLAAATSQLQDTLTQILPTRTDLRYEWTTQFNPRNFGFLSFQYKGSTDQTELPPVKFTLTSTASINFLTATREWNSLSTLGPFKLGLMGDLVSLYFESAKFIAGDKIESHMSVAFSKVEVGPQLQFLKALQSFMSPSAGNGPFVDVRPSSITAGYRFNAGLIQVGSLQFINVSLEVFAFLPLKGLTEGQLAAQIGFGFGSEARPFLIAQPPYGGGGYVQLTYDGSVKKLVPKISLSFGAVVAIKFGPLDGHGRVTSTITWSNDLIRASVEAVGEGHIACFGIAVMLQVALEDRGGVLKGSATYSFEFSVGFLSVSFSFEVSYTIQGGEGSQEKQNAHGKPNANGELISPSVPRFLDTAFRTSSYAGVDLLGDDARADDEKKKLCFNPSDPATRRIRVIAPQKAHAWGSYRKRLSMSLLNN